MGSFKRQELATVAIYSTLITIEVSPTQRHCTSQTHGERFIAGTKLPLFRQHQSKSKMNKAFVALSVSRECINKPEQFEHRTFATNSIAKNRKSKYFATKETNRTTN